MQTTVTILPAMTIVSYIDNFIAIDTFYIDGEPIAIIKGSDRDKFNITIFGHSPIIKHDLSYRECVTQLWAHISR